MTSYFERKILTVLYVLDNFLHKQHFVAPCFSCMIQKNLAMLKTNRHLLRCCFEIRIF